VVVSARCPENGAEASGSRMCSEASRDINLILLKGNSERVVLAIHVMYCTDRPLAFKVLALRNCMAIDNPREFIVTNIEMYHVSSSSVHELTLSPRGNTCAIGVVVAEQGVIALRGMMQQLHYYKLQRVDSAITNGTALPARQVFMHTPIGKHGASNSNYLSVFATK
jgi:hypothetical protein